MSDPQTTPCAHQGCTHTARTTTLYRVNEPGEPGVFMCRTHWTDAAQKG